MNEEWKMYHGYRVSNTGRCQWNDNGVWREKKEKTCRNYRCVTLKVDGKQKEIATQMQESWRSATTVPTENACGADYQVGMMGTDEPTH